MIYLASPYTHESPAVREARYEAACVATARLTESGATVFSPVVHSHPLVRFGFYTGWQTWQAIDEEFLSLAEELFVLCLPGWKKSVGVQAEIRFAHGRKIAVQLIDPRAASINVDALAAIMTNTTEAVS